MDIMRDIQIKKAPSGLIIEKEGKRISFEGKSGELIQKVLEQEYKKANSKSEFLNHIISSVGQLSIKEDFNNIINSIKDKRIFLFLSKDNISEKVVGFLKKLNIKEIKIFNFPFVPKEITEQNPPDYLIIYHNQPVRNYLFFLNNFAIQNNIRFIRAFREGNQFIIAPFVIPYETACYSCYTFLKTKNQIYDFDTLNNKEIKFGEVSELPELVSSFCANLFILKAMHFLGRKIHHIDQLQEIVLNLSDFDTAYNPVLKVPNCSDCNVKSIYQ